MMELEEAHERFLCQAGELGFDVTGDENGKVLLQATFLFRSH